MSGKRRRKKPSLHPSAAERPPDPRIIAAEVADPFVNPDGTPAGGVWAQVISPLMLRDGRIALFPGAQVSALYICQSKEYCDRAERQRQRWLSALRPDPSEPSHFRAKPEYSSVALDVIALYASAVLLAYASIEAFANAASSFSDAPPSVTVKRRDGDVVVDQADFERLGTGEKLSLVVPLVPGAVAIKGTKPWEHFKRLQRLRNDLVHVKGRGYSSDPHDPSAFGQLLRGDARTCADDAVAVMNAALPGWITERLLRRL